MKPVLHRKTNTIGAADIKNDWVQLVIVAFRDDIGVELVIIMQIVPCVVSCYQRDVLSFLVPVEYRREMRLSLTHGVVSVEF